MVRFVAAGPAGGSSLGTPEILGAGQLVAAVVDYVVAGQPGRDIRAQLLDLYLHHDPRKDQKSFQKIGRDHDAQGNQSEGSFAGQAGLGTRQGGPDRADELAPWRGPFDGQLGRVVKFDGLFELEGFTHAGGTLPSFAIVISILSPTAVLVSAAVRHGSSRTDAACVRTGAKRQGCKSPWM